MNTVEQEQGEIIRELLAERQSLRDENRDLRIANDELDAEVGCLNRDIDYLNARLMLEKAGYRCTCYPGEEAA